MMRLALIGEKKITDHQIIVEFATSKMTVIDEMLSRHEYFEMQFVEFQEFVCRLANFLYQDQQHPSKRFNSPVQKSEGIIEGQSIYVLVETFLEELLTSIDAKLIPLHGGDETDE